MNYLAGPLTRTQIPALNQLVGAEIAEPTEQAPAPDPKDEHKGSTVAMPVAAIETLDKKPEEAPGSTTRPAVPSGIAEYFLPNNLTMMEAFRYAKQPLPKEAMSQGLLYKPVLLAQADVRYMQRKYDLDHEQKFTALVPDVDRRGTVRWEEFSSEPVSAREISQPPDPNARFAVIEGALADSKLIKAAESDFVDYIYRSAEVKVLANETLKTFAGPPTTEGEFRKLLSAAARDERDAEIKAVEKKYKTKIDAVKKKLQREQRELAEDEKELSARKLEELGTHAENVLSLLGGSRSRRRVSTSLSKRRMTSQAKADVEESLDAIEELENELAELAEEIEAAVDEVEDKWAEIAQEIEEIPITPYKKDILVEIFGLAWMPFHIVEIEGGVIELPGFSAG
jgi:hypothetical protein